MTHLLVELQNKLRITEAELRCAQAAALKAEERALVAEQSSRDAWAFARTVLRTGRR